MASKKVTKKVNTTKKHKGAFPGITILSLSVACGIALLVFGFMCVPIWHIKTVAVINNSYVPSSYILGKLNMPQSATLFTLRTKDISAQFANDRYIKGVTLKRHFPRTLILDMHVREPLYKAMIDDEFFVFDETGMVLNAQTLFKVPTEKCFKLSSVKAFKDIPHIMTELKPALPQLKVFNDPSKVIINCRNLDAIQVVY